MNMGKLPVNPKEPEVPILPSNRWIKTGNALVKVYDFRRLEDKPKFVVKLLNYETQVQHNAMITITETNVTIQVTTTNIGVTELDFEYARFSDSLYKDVVYSPDHARRENDQAG